MSGRIGPQARLVLDVLSGSRCHLTADEVLEKLPGASSATVYRALDSLADSGIITRLSIGSKRAVYEFTREPHMHLVCKKCGGIYDIGVDITSMVRATMECSGHTVDRVDTTAYGLCSQCVRKTILQQEE